MKETQIVNEPKILEEPQILKETQIMNELKILIQQQILKETQSTNEPEFQKLTKLQTNPKFKIVPNFERSSITNEP